MTIPAAKRITLPELMERTDEAAEAYEDDEVSTRDLLITAMNLLADFQTWAENTGLTE